MRRFAVAAVCALVALGCGGEANEDLSRRASDVPVTVPAMPDAASPDSLPPTSPPPPAEQQPTVPAPFEDPGCPPVEMPPVNKECDPFGASTGCPAGQSCFPFVRYPEGPCEIEQYGTTCLPTGPGLQGSACSRQACAAGHICISTGRGTQCARICSFAEDAEDVCAPGLLCLPIDIEGFGGCL